MGFWKGMDRTTRLFQNQWSRPKRGNSQVNGHTEMNLSTLILRRDAKARHR
ncbi:MAG: YpzG family protein [Caldibacillus sp.]